MPAGAEPFDPLAAPLLGAASHGRLRLPSGRVMELAGSALSAPPRQAARDAAISCLLALALHQRWLRERADSDLTAAISYVHDAAWELPQGHPLRRRLAQLQASLLLDRGQVSGDHADASAAVVLLAELTEASAGAPPPDLNQLLDELLTLKAGRRSSAPDLSEVLSPSAADAVTNDTYRAELAADIGAAQLQCALLSGRKKDREKAITNLELAASHLPDNHPLRPDTFSNLGLARLADADYRDDAVGVQAAGEVMVTAASCQPGHPRQAAMLVRAAGALAVGGSDENPELVNQAVADLRKALSTAGLTTFGERSRCLHALGRALLLRFDRAACTEDLDLALSSLEEARASLDTTPGDPFIVPLMRTLALAYRAASQNQPGWPRRQSRAAARSVLHAHGRAVLLQSTPRQGLAAARRIRTDTLRLAAWCLADGLPVSAVEALELGRGLVLHAATVAADVPDLLRDAGRADLAEEWHAATAARLASDGRPRPGDVPGDLRHRVLAALRGGAAERRLLSAPEVPQIATALQAAGMDALVYLIPESDELAGRALMVTSAGSVDDCPLPGLSAASDSGVARYADARREPAADQQQGQALGELCDWAWAVAIGPVLWRLSAAELRIPRPPRLVIAPIGVLGIVPWHAARRPGSAGANLYACREAVFSTCASARQLIEATSRKPVPWNGPVVVVAGVARRLPFSRVEGDAICSAFYSDAVYLGRSSQTPVRGSGTAAEILAWLPGGQPNGCPAAVLHLGCHARTGPTPDLNRLILARRGDGYEDLAAGRILAQAQARAADAPGGLVVLSACSSDLSEGDHDEALTLASAFLAAGAKSVVGSRWEVDDQHTALLMFMLHYHLGHHPNDSTADALRAAQLWMLDPGRSAPAEMPVSLASMASKPELANLTAWAAFTHTGC